MPDLERWDWAWLAGIFEGEGTIGFNNNTSVQLRIGMTDADVIETVFRLFPGTSVRRIERKNRIRPLYCWQLSSRDAVREFLEGVLPYLHERRGARAREALDRLDRNPGARSLRTHCKHGHPLSGDNLYVARTTGARSCQTCRTRRDHERDRRVQRPRREVMPSARP